MLPHVYPEVRQGDRPVTANCARERLLARMSFDVRLERRALVTDVAALRATEYFHPGMYLHVPREVCKVGKAGVAFVATERLLVGVFPHVALEESGSLAGVAALGTAERFLSGVLPDVPLEFRSGPACVSAVGAFERLFA